MNTETIRSFALEIGCSQATLKSRISQEKIEPAGKRGEHTVYRLRDLVRAFLGGDLASERLRETKERADKLALENERTRGSLVSVEMVARAGELIFVSVRQIILNSSLLDSEKDALLLNLLGLKNRDWSKP